ncbi:uncharacterized protein LOC108105577 isoform X2 [Drosophila eugracilis]|uniref:uncharacterized protein LOC108105577 isoform X2 n=1 Tax=Drosophila eugracilis TaxID=29029 RepID=UPI001BDB08D2|nr:uncharacterized protein LOC108105577 isoform X2 [Drosophila eugracilis]
MQGQTYQEMVEGKRFYPSNCDNTYDMELLKVNNFYEPKNNIVQSSSDFRKRSTNFDGYLGQIRSLSKINHSHQIGTSLSLIRSENFLCYPKPPKPKRREFSTYINNPSEKCQNYRTGASTVTSAIRSRADRIARIETRDYKLNTKLKLQIDKPTTKPNETSPKISRCFFLKSFYDKGISAPSNHYSKEKCNHFQMCHDGESAEYENIKEHIVTKNYESLYRFDKVKPHENLNDLQNFSKKNVTKATTTELLKATAEKVKKCNIDLGRKLKSLNDIQQELTLNGSLVLLNADSRQSPTANIRSGKFITPFKMENGAIFSKGNYNDINKFMAPSRLHSIRFVSSTSVSLCSCSGTCLGNSSEHSYEEDCSEWNEHKYSRVPLYYYSHSCSNALEGVFRNNSYDDFPTNLDDNCSTYSCDGDDCSYFDRNSCDSSSSIQKLETRSETENFKQKKVILLKDAELRFLRHGHVLKEILETERIYVNEMSSIIKSNVKDQLLLEEFQKI